MTNNKKKSKTMVSSRDGAELVVNPDTGKFDDIIWEVK